MGFILSKHTPVFQLGCNHSSVSQKLIFFPLIIFHNNFAFNKKHIKEIFKPSLLLSFKTFPHFCSATLWPSSFLTLKLFSQHTDLPSQFSVRCELAKDALHLVTESTSEAVVQGWSQSQHLRNVPSNYPPKIHASPHKDLPQSFPWDWGEVDWSSVPWTFDCLF